MAGIMVAGRHVTGAVVGNLHPRPQTGGTRRETGSGMGF